MGQFSVEDKFPFSVIILELEISAFPPWHLLSARSGCLSMCVCVFVTNNNRICLKKKKQKTSFIQSSHSITSLLWYTPCTTWSWIRIPPTCHKKKTYIIKYISSSTWLTFNEHWFHIENTPFPVPYRWSHQPLQFRPVWRSLCFFALLCCMNRVSVSPS